MVLAKNKIPAGKHSVLRCAERLTIDFWNHRLILGWPQLATADNANEQTYDTSVYFM